MTDLSTSAKDIFSKSGPGLPASQSTSEIIHGFIIERMPKIGEPLSEAALHHFASPGKMLRAKMALRAADHLNVDRYAALHWAAAIEVLHNASLIHDDICDGDRLRRDRPAVWSVYGRDVALTLGDWLVALSFELAAEAAQRAQTPMLVKILATHMKTTTDGEAREFDVQPVRDWDHYLKGAGDKTAPLLTAPLEGVAAMALHGGAAPIIGDCFRALGNAYQIANDILNFSGGDGANTRGSDLGRRAPMALSSCSGSSWMRRAGTNSTAGTPAVPAMASTAGSMNSARLARQARQHGGWRAFLVMRRHMPAGCQRN